MGDNSQRWFSLDKSGEAADALRRLFQEATDNRAVRCLAVSSFVNWQLTVRTC